MKKPSEADFVGKDIRRTMLKVHILWKAKAGGANAYSLTKEFGEDKLISSYYANKKELRDDVYNVARGLEKAGLLTSRRRIENGRLKQYYSLTIEGERVLRSSIDEFLKGAKGIAAIFRE